MAYIVDYDTTFGAAITNIAQNIPAHEADDILLMINTHNAGATTVVTAGWSAPVNDATNAANTSSWSWIRATSNATTLNITTADDYCCTVLVIRDAILTGSPIDVNTQTGSAVSTSTPSNVSVTTVSADCLVVYMMSVDGIATQAHSDPGVHFLTSYDNQGTTAATAVTQSVAWYYQRAIGATPVARWVASAAGVYARATIAIKHKTNGKIPAYVDDSTLPGTTMMVGHHFSTLNNLTFQAPTITNVGPAGTGRAVTSDALAATADYGINPYSAALASTPSTTAATAASGYEVLFGTTHDVTTDFIVGTIIAANPKMAQYNLGSIKQGGAWLVTGDNSNYYHSFQIMARDASQNTEGRSIFSVQPNQGGTVNGYSGTTIATYASSNQSGVTSLYTGSVVGAGQSFAGTGVQVSVIRLWLKKTGVPEGFATVRCYAHSGTLGTSSIPTGPVLAESYPINVEKLTTSYANVDFKIKTAWTPTNAVNYVFTVEYSGGSVGNTLDVGTDTTTPTAPTGNFATLTGTVWTAVSGTDMIYTIYRAPVLSALKKLQILFNCPSGAITEYIAEVHRARAHIVAGGTSLYPVDAIGLSEIGKSFRVPLLQLTGAAGILAYVPIQVGGGDAVYFKLDAGSIQFPRVYDPEKKQINFHCAPNATGIRYAGKSGDTIIHTNSVVTSASPYYWEITTGATSAATWSFSGLNVVNAAMVFRPVTTFTDMTATAASVITTNASTFSGCIFNQCVEITAASATFTGCVFTASTGVNGGALSITGASQAAIQTELNKITNSNFITNTIPLGALRIIYTGTAGAVALNMSSNTFSSNTADIRWEAPASSNLTLNLSGTATPSTYTATNSNTVTFVNARTFSISNVILNSEVRIYRASDLVELAGCENTNTTGTPAQGVNNASISADPDNAGKYIVTYAYNYSVDIPVVIVVLNNQYQALRTTGTLKSTNQTIPVNQLFDRQYLNP